MGKTHQELPTVFEPFCSARRRYCAALNWSRICRQQVVSHVRVGIILLVGSRNKQSRLLLQIGTADGAWRPNLRCVSNDRKPAERAALTLLVHGIGGIAILAVGARKEAARENK